MSDTKIMDGEEEEEENEAIPEEEDSWEGEVFSDLPLPSRPSVSDEQLRQFRAEYAASHLNVTGKSCPTDVTSSASSKDTLVHKMAHERTKLAHFKGTERRLSSRSAMSVGGMSIVHPLTDFPEAMPASMREEILAFYEEHNKIRRDSDVIPDTDGFFHTVQAIPHKPGGPLQDPNADKYRAINRREDAYNVGGYIDDKSELQRVAGANRSIWGTRRHTDGYIKFLYHEALAAERNRVWRKVPTVDDFVPTLDEVMGGVNVDELLPSQLDKKCKKTGLPVWWSDRNALERGSHETIEVIRHIHNKIQEMKNQRYEEFMENYQSEFKMVKFFDQADTDQLEGSKQETSSEESYVLKPEPPFFIDEKKLVEEDVIEDPWRTQGLYDVHKDDEPPSGESSTDDSQKTIKSLGNMRASRGTSRLLKKKMFSVPTSSPVTSVHTPPVSPVQDRSKEPRRTIGSIAISRISGKSQHTVSSRYSRSTTDTAAFDDEPHAVHESTSTISSYGEEYFSKLRDQLQTYIENFSKEKPDQSKLHNVISDVYPLSNVPEKDMDLVDNSSIESIFLLNKEEGEGEEEEEEFEVEPPPPRTKRYASQFLNEIVAKGNKPKDDSLFSIKDQLDSVIDILPVKYKPYDAKRPPYKGYDDYLDLKNLVAEVAAPYEPQENDDDGEDDFAFVTDPPKWQRIQKRCHRMRDKPDRLVQVYKCMSRRLGLPTFELVARALYSKTADFTRLGRAPPGCLRVAFSLLERNLALQQLYLSGLSMSRDDVLHLNSLFKKATKLQRILLANAKLNAEHLNLLRDALKDLPNLCFLDLSSNRIGDKGLQVFLRGVGEITNISTLILKKNNLTSACLSGFKVLCGNWTSITSLDLSWNEINDGPPLVSFANFIVRRETMPLTELRMAWNGLEGNACANAMSILASMESMKYLDISFNNFCTETEMAVFNHLLHSSSLEFFIMQDNPIRGVPTSILIGDLVWTKEPTLKLIDLGDIWLEKSDAEHCNELLRRYGVVVKYAQIMANYDIPPPDMRKIFIQRFQFLNRRTKKKNLGQLLLKLEYKNQLFPMRRAEFYDLIEKAKLKMDEGLDIALGRAFIQRGRVNVVQMLRMFMELYPSAKFLGAKKPKKKKKKKKGRVDSSDEEVTRDDHAPLDLRELWVNKTGEKPSKLNARFLDLPGAEDEDEDDKRRTMRTHIYIIADDDDETEQVVGTAEVTTTYDSTSEGITTGVTTDGEDLSEAITEEATTHADEMTTAEASVLISAPDDEMTIDEATTAPETSEMEEDEGEG